MRLILIVLTLLSHFLLLFPQGAAAAFPELVDPRYMIVDNGQIIISDYPHLFIYSLSDYSLTRKIGRAGEGPSEFDLPKQNMNLKDRGLVISVCPDYISAGSVGRVSYFKRNGDFLRLTKIPYGINSKFLFLCDKLLGFIPQDGKLSVFLFDVNMNKQGKILECDYWLDFKRNEMENFFDRASDTLLTAVQDNKIFMIRGDAPSFAVNVFDFDGRKLSTIKHKTEKIKIPKSFVDRIHEYFRLKYRSKNSDYFIKNLNLPDDFPAVRKLCAADHKLYAVTFKETAGKTEVLIFSTKGDFLEKIRLPVKERNPEQLFPLSISNDTFYQLEENEEKENWELFVTPIK